MSKQMIPVTDGSRYIPYEMRSGNESIVYFTRDLSAEGLLKVYDKVSACLSGKIGIKLHTGEPQGPNIIPRPWVKELMENEPALKDAVIVDTNTFYPGDRDSTEKHRETIKTSKRVANPGCHATGFISVVYPLVAMGLVSPDACLSAFSLTGYSGGGKKMIAQYEAEDKESELFAPCPYGMTQAHKHLPEMKAICGLTHKPVFTPIVDDYYKGMATTVPFHMSQLTGVSTLKEVWQKLSDYYAGSKMVQVLDSLETAKVYANAKAGQDTLSLIVAGNDQQFTVTALFDNLGKGASGAAVQNMNIMLGLDETTSLSV